MFRLPFSHVVCIFPSMLAMHAALLSLALAPLICAALYCDASDDCAESTNLNIKLTYFDVSSGRACTTYRHLTHPLRALAGPRLHALLSTLGALNLRMSGCRGRCVGHYISCVNYLCFYFFLFSSSSSFLNLPTSIICQHISIIRAIAATHPNRRNSSRKIKPVNSRMARFLFSKSTESR